jgi:hypothetical protein
MARDLRLKLMKPQFGDASITGDVCYLNKRSRFLPAFAGKTKCVFAISVRKRWVRMLVLIIKRYAGVPNPENRITIYSDGWSSYSDLKTMGYNHGVVVHRRNFLNSTNRHIHIQTVERLNLH